MNLDECWVKLKDGIDTVFQTSGNHPGLDTTQYMVLYTFVAGCYLSMLPLTSICY